MKKFLTTLFALVAIGVFAGTYDLVQMELTDISDGVSARREFQSIKKITGNVKAVFIDLSGIDAAPTSDVSVVTVADTILAPSQTILAKTGVTADIAYYPVKQLVTNDGTDATDAFCSYAVMQQYIKLMVTNNSSTNISVNVDVLYERR